MIKKFLLGCGIITLLLIVVFTGAAIYITMKVKDIEHSWKDAFSEIDSLEDKYPFSIPEEGEIDITKFEEYLVIRDSISTEFSKDPTIKKLTSSSSNVEDLGFGDLWSLGTNFGPSITEKFGELLDNSQMPPSEYAFYVRVAYSTISQGTKSGNQDMDEIYEFLDDGVDDINAKLSKLEMGELQVPFSATILSYKDGKAHVSDETTSTLAENKDEFMEWPGMCFIELMVADRFKPGEKNMQNFNVPTKFGGIEMEKKQE